jgi:hypothetical protein
MKSFVVAMLLIGCGGASSSGRDARVADGSADADAVGDDGADAAADTASDVHVDRAGDVRDETDAVDDPQCTQFTVDAIACGANDAGSIPRLGGHYCALCDGEDPTGRVTGPLEGCITLMNGELPLLCVAVCSECS